MKLRYLEKLSRESLREILLRISEIMSKEQQEDLERIIKEYAGKEALA